MVYGPCGGVQPDGVCEIGELSCPFVERPLAVWEAEQMVAEGARPAPPAPRATELAAALGRGGVVVGDLPARALDRESLLECAAILGGLDAVLSGDTPANRVQFPPSYRATLIHDAGAVAWVGLNARDRNRVALEAELAALADLGVAAVHCVTGDHPLSGSRPDAAPVFDVDSTTLASMARAHGLLVSVGETPVAPPARERPRRLLSKERAGAGVCFIDHAGSAEAVVAFVERCRELGSHAAMIACVALVCDGGSLALIDSFHVPALPQDARSRILAAADPRQAGIDFAVELGRRLLDTGAVAGINLSGGPSPGGELAYAEALARAAQELRR
jgi:5,10-methylenetetrahydrofolate reductase